MDREEAMKLLKGGEEGIAEWNRGREASEAIPELYDVDLSGAKLIGADLSYVKLSGAKLIGADLTDATLTSAHLVGADVGHANLSDANLTNADLVGADLTSADLTGAHLYATNLTAAYLIDTEVSIARFGWTWLCDLDLTVANGLESVVFGGPCPISTSTLDASKGRIPESFLRGCGLQPWEVLSAKMYDPSLSSLQITDLQGEIFRLRTEGPLYVGGVLISYSRTDTTAVDKLKDRFEKDGIRVWVDRHDLVAGPLQRQLVRGIRFMDTVVLVLSEASVNSDWVDQEVRAARVKEREEKREVLCPIALDHAWKKKVGRTKSLKEMEEADADWAHLAKKNVLDFSQWKTRAFEPQFQKLLKGLKIYYPPAESSEA